MSNEKSRSGRRRKAVVLALVLPIAATAGFFWHSERVATEALDMPFLEACEGRWKGPNVHGEFTCQLSLAEVNDRREAETQSKAFLDKADQELKSKGWETNSGCYTFPSTAGHIEVHPLTNLMIVVNDNRPNIIYKPNSFQIVMKRPQSVLREYLRDAKNSLQQRITGVKTDPSSLRCKTTTLARAGSFVITGAP
jgi:hypothetical protein